MFLIELYILLVTETLTWPEVTEMLNTTLAESSPRVNPYPVLV